MKVSPLTIYGMSIVALIILGFSLASDYWIKATLPRGDEYNIGILRICESAECQYIQKSELLTSDTKSESLKVTILMFISAAFLALSFLAAGSKTIKIVSLVISTALSAAAVGVVNDKVIPSIQKMNQSRLSRDEVKTETQYGYYLALAGCVMTGITAILAFKMEEEPEEEPIV